MKKTIPLISSIVSGPLGVKHLVRLWQKALLAAQGQLADGYPAAGTGFDQMVIDGLGLERSAVLNFINTAKPTYPEFEAWIKEQPGVKLDEVSIQSLNDSIFAYNHDDETRVAILAAAGIPDDEHAPHDAVSLNQLEDWMAFHAEVVPATETASAQEGGDTEDDPQTTDGTTPGRREEREVAAA